LVFIAQVLNALLLLLSREQIPFLVSRGSIQQRLVKNKTFRESYSQVVAPTLRQCLSREKAVRKNGFQNVKLSKTVFGFSFRDEMVSIFRLKKGPTKIKVS
jgi:transcription-repair coupling factor (superfamily II helicase)